MSRGKGDQRRTVAEPDLERASGTPAEKGIEVQRIVGLLARAVQRPEVAPRPLLGDRHAAGAGDETADCAPVRDGVGSLAGRRRLVWHRWCQMDKVRFGGSLKRQT